MATKYVLVMADQDQEEVFDSLEEVQQSLEDGDYDDETLETAKVYKASEVYVVEQNGIELEKSEFDE